MNQKTKDVAWDIGLCASGAVVGGLFMYLILNPQSECHPTDNPMPAILEQPDEGLAPFPYEIPGTIPEALVTPPPTTEAPTTTEETTTIPPTTAAPTTAAPPDTVSPPTTKQPLRGNDFKTRPGTSNRDKV